MDLMHNLVARFFYENNGLDENKAVFTAPSVACRWAGAFMQVDYLLARIRTGMDGWTVGPTNSD